MSLATFCVCLELRFPYGVSGQAVLDCLPRVRRRLSPVNSMRAAIEATLPKGSKGPSGYIAAWRTRPAGGDARPGESYRADPAIIEE
jgi:hypothetical protein